jgi:hypothetical protein
MERLYKIGVFDNVDNARHAIDDVVASGVSEDAIALIVPEDEPKAIDEGHAKYLVHPTSDTERGHFGGGIGGAIGGFAGSLTMYLIGRGYDLTYRIDLIAGVIAGIVVGALAGAYLARVLPQIANFFLKGTPPEYFGPIGHRYDSNRSMVAGAIGGAIGALGGTLGSYLIGVPNIWYFVSTGLWAGAVSLILGMLVGAMSGRGLSTRSVGRFEDLADAGHNILVSVDCSHSREKLPQIEDLLRRDGATMVQSA